jgi:hypothetical protein
VWTRISASELEFTSELAASLQPQPQESYGGHSAGGHGGWLRKGGAPLTRPAAVPRHRRLPSGHHRRCGLPPLAPGPLTDHSLSVCLTKQPAAARACSRQPVPLCLPPDLPDSKALSSRRSFGEQRVGVR